MRSLRLMLQHSCRHRPVFAPPGKFAATAGACARSPFGVVSAALRLTRIRELGTGFSHPFFRTSLSVALPAICRCPPPLMRREAGTRPMSGKNFRTTTGRLLTRPSAHGFDRNRARSRFWNRLATVPQLSCNRPAIVLQSSRNRPAAAGKRLRTRYATALQPLRTIPEPFKTR